MHLKWCALNKRRYSETPKINNLKCVLFSLNFISSVSMSFQNRFFYLSFYLSISLFYDGPFFSLVVIVVFLLATVIFVCPKLFVQLKNGIRIG